MSRCSCIAAAAAACVFVHPCLLLLPLLMRTQVATQFFGLQVVIVFLASFISGTVFNQLSLLLSNPQRVLAIIGTGEGSTH